MPRRSGGLRASCRAMNSLNLPGVAPSPHQPKFTDPPMPVLPSSSPSCKPSPRHPWRVLRAVLTTRPIWRHGSGASSASCPGLIMVKVVVVVSEETAQGRKQSSLSQFRLESPLQLVMQNVRKHKSRTGVWTKGVKHTWNLRRVVTYQREASR